MFGLPDKNKKSREIYGSQKMKFPDFSRFSLAKMNEFPDCLDVKID